MSLGSSEANRAVVKAGLSLIAPREAVLAGHDITTYFITKGNQCGATRISASA